MNLKQVIEPKSIAVIGVSLSNPFNPANVIFTKNRLRYQARTYCINPKGGKLYGDTVYTSISEIPEKVDLAIFSIRADMIPRSMEECIAAGVSGGIIISGGFSESGRQDLQEEIVRITTTHSFPVLGPNCLGIFSPPHIDTFFLPNERLIDLKKGNVALISQSGGILVDLTIRLTQEGVGISRAVSIGNKAVLDEVDLLQFFIKDPATQVIGFYIEGFSNGRGRLFIEEVNHTKKPVVIMKSGKTPDGSKAVSSHTASLSGDYITFSEIIKGSRAVEAADEAEFAAFCEVLSRYSASNVKNVCIITASGGHGAIASDGCYSAGITTVDIPKNDQEELKNLVSKSIQGIASFSNPIDLTGSAVDDDFITTTRYFIGKEYVDCVLILLLPYLPGITSDVGARIAQIARESGKPVVTYIPHVDKYGIFIDGFESNGIPVAHSVEGAVSMVRAIAGGKL
ncbi:MAG: acetate--CoA ligase family protein [Spirochaetota bacterium]